MSEHYYSNKPSAKHDLRKIKEELRGTELIFTTDAGVFSKGGVDFGSKLLIETMEIKPGYRVLDVGCGYGPIGLAAARLATPGVVTMLDINERAVELARENAIHNGIDNVEIIVSDLFEQVRGLSFDCILTNPPIRTGKETVHRIFELAWEHLVLGGELWIVIQKKQGAPSALTKLESLFTTVQDVAKSKGFHIFKCTK
ncbi:MAG: class I SAM-dependent methyltransferase [Gorillibacterium sp.]|nr:class I SAM-dependent methyltransferase [Gorillibacterium sp.]